MISGAEPMHTQARFFIRTALACLLAAFVVGGLVLLNKGIPLLSWLWTLRVTHVHLLLVGWTVQVACGVAFWILPRLDASGSRGNERLAWLCYGALNIGVVLAALHDPLAAAVGESAITRAMPVIAGVLYVVAITAFVAHAAPRIVLFQVQAT
jgi:hypothetical protein